MYTFRSQPLKLISDNFQPTGSLKTRPITDEERNSKPGYSTELEALQRAISLHNGLVDGVEINREKSLERLTEERKQAITQHEDGISQLKKNPPRSSAGATPRFLIEKADKDGRNSIEDTYTRGRERSRTKYDSQAEQNNPEWQRWARALSERRKTLLDN